ncbi:MAG: hypothetical protein AB1416_01430 [Actinomycetota bacterium]
MNAGEIAFYASTAGLIPILLMAVAFQLTLEKWWELEEPVYRAIFPYMVGGVTLFMSLAEIVALAALAGNEDFYGSKVLVLLGVVLPLLLLGATIVTQAAEIHEDFSWSKAFEEWEAVATRKRQAQDRRAAERAEFRARGRALRKTMGRWRIFVMVLRGVLPPPPGWLRRRRQRAGQVRQRDPSDA